MSLSQSVDPRDRHCRFDLSKDYSGPAVSGLACARHRTACALFSCYTSIARVKHHHGFRGPPLQDLSAAPDLGTSALRFRQPPSRVRLISDVHRVLHPATSLASLSMIVRTLLNTPATLPLQMLARVSRNWPAVRTQCGRSACLMAGTACKLSEYCLPPELIQDTPSRALSLSANLDVRTPRLRRAMLYGSPPCQTI